MRAIQSWCLVLISVPLLVQKSDIEMLFPSVCDEEDGATEYRGVQQPRSLHADVDRQPQAEPILASMPLSLAATRDLIRE